MTMDVISVDENTPITKVIQLIEENAIQHVPVTRKNRLVGMITERDVHEAYPSKGTAIKAKELYFLLAEMKAKNVMKRDPVIISPDQTMEVAAVKMLEHKVSAMPVVRKGDEIVGIISQGDVFRVLISITGIYQRGVQIAFNLEDRAGSIKEVADYIREEEGQIVSILSTSDTADEGYRHVFIRIKHMPDGRLQRLIAKLEKEFMLLYVVKDPFKDI